MLALIVIERTANLCKQISSQDFTILSRFWINSGLQISGGGSSIMHKVVQLIQKTGTSRLLSSLLFMTVNTKFNDALKDICSKVEFKEKVKLEAADTSYIESCADGPTPFS
jgi:hypothetical protein